MTILGENSYVLKVWEEFKYKECTCFCDECIKVVFNKFKEKFPAHATYLKLIEETEATSVFSSLPLGTEFKYKDNTYMKTKSHEVITYDKEFVPHLHNGNCLNLETFVWGEFKPSTYVERING